MNLPAISRILTTLFVVTAAPFLAWHRGFDTKDTVLVFFLTAAVWGELLSIQRKLDNKSPW